MKLTKFGHSCVLVEVEANGTVQKALFDPGVWSNVPVQDFVTLDEVFISHGHPDHIDIPILRAIVAAFPNVRITAPTEVVAQLHQAGFLQAADVAPLGSKLFVSPHEGHLPFMDPPEEIGIHFLDRYSHPGDSHSFHETMPVLGLPVQAPWGSMIAAVDLALELKPQYVLPLHDWHWRDEARAWAYDRMGQIFKDHDITLLGPVDGQAIEIPV